MKNSTPNNSTDMLWVDTFYVALISKFLSTGISRFSRQMLEPTKHDTHIFVLRPQGQMNFNGLVPVLVCFVRTSSRFQNIPKACGSSFFLMLLHIYCFFFTKHWSKKICRRKRRELLLHLARKLNHKICSTRGQKCHNIRKEACTSNKIFSLPDLRTCEKVLWGCYS